MPKKKKGKRGSGAGGSVNEKGSPTSISLQVRQNALQHLQDTFASQVDPDVVYFILAECDYNVDAALENLLTLAAENTPASELVPNNDLSSDAILKVLNGMNPSRLESFEDDASTDSFSSRCTKEELGCNPSCSTSTLYAGSQEIYISNEDLYTGDGSLEKFKSADQFVFGAQALSLFDAVPTTLETKEDSPDYSASSSNTDLRSPSVSCDNIDSFAETFDTMKISVSSHSDSSIEADASESVVTPNQENSVSGSISPNCAGESVTDVQVSDTCQSAFRTIEPHRRSLASPFVQHTVIFGTGITENADINSSDSVTAGKNVKVSTFSQCTVQSDTGSAYSVDSNSLHSLPNGRSLEIPPYDQRMMELNPNFSNPLCVGKSGNTYPSMGSSIGAPQFVPQWIVPTIPNHQPLRKTPTPNTSPRPPFWCYSNGAQFSKVYPSSSKELNANGTRLSADSNCGDGEVCQRERLIHSINRGDKVLVILRGLPGSGKSTLAQQLKRGGLIFSTDNYFSRKGCYSYDVTKLSEAHEWNKHLAGIALKEGRSPIIIDNTNTQSWEMKPYVLLGLQYGYHIEIVESDTPWRFQPKILAAKNTHNISKDKIKQMLERYEHHVSIRSILASCNAKSLSKSSLLQFSADNVVVNEEPDKQLPSPPKLPHKQPPSQPMIPSQSLLSEKEAVYRHSPVHEEVLCQFSSEAVSEMETDQLKCDAELVSEEIITGSQPEAVTNFNLVAAEETCESVQIEEGLSKNNECSISPKSTQNIKHRKKVVYPKLPDDYNVEDPDFWVGEAESTEIPDDEIMSSPTNNPICASKRRNLRRRHEQGNVTLPLSDDKLSTEVSPCQNSNLNSWGRRPSITLTDTDWKESHNANLESSASTDDIFDVLDVFDLPKPPRNIPDKVYTTLTHDQATLDNLVEPCVPLKCQKHKSSRRKLAAIFSQACCADCNWEIPKFPDTVSAIIEDSPKNVAINTCTASTETDNKYFLLAEDANMETCDAEGIVTRICRKRSICDRTYTPVAMLTVGPLKMDKGCMTDDSVCTTNSDFLQSCFPDLPSEFVEDIFNKCAGNIEWAASILVEPDSKVLNSDPLIANALESDDARSTELSESDVVVLSVKDLHTSESNSGIADSIDKISTNDDTSQFEILLDSNVEPPLPQENESNMINPTINFPPTSTHHDSTSSPEKYYISNSSNEDPEEFSENNSSPNYDSSSEVLMRLDPVFASQLEKLFGPLGFTESSDHKDDDFVFQIHTDLAWKIYECWARSLRKKTEEEDLQFETTFCDESVAKRLQEEEDAHFAQMSTTQSHAALSACAKAGTEKRSSVPSLQEIMDLEMALQLSKDDAIKHRENKLSNGDMATKLKRQKMYEMFPKMDRESLDEIFTAHNFSLTETVQALQEQNSNEELISAAILENYEQQILDAVIKESREIAKSATPTAMIKPVDFPHQDHESGVEDFRSEATLHYRMRQECFTKAQTAYTSGMKAVASFYAQQGHLHGKKMWEANQRASRRILMHQNLGREKNTIDLHLLYVGEAVQLLDEYLTHKLDELQHCSDRKMIINVIVGRGRHSADKVPRLKLAVCDYLRRNDFRFEEKHAGLIQVKLT